MSPTPGERKILFIINPNAGKRNPASVIATIQHQMPAGLAYEVTEWTDKKHFEKIEEQIRTGGFTDVVAVGGDGTVNHVAKTILNSGAALGILPIGSGNGLARTLGLSMRIPDAIKQIAAGKTTTIDSGEVNGIPFFCTSGVGFDARIGDLFATSAKRGLQSYVKITLAELFRYRAKKYTININGQVLEKKAFLITVANAGQYGNDFYIAPLASVQDGLFHVVVLKPFSVVTVAGLMAKILSRKAHLSRYIETYVANQLSITRENGEAIHFDGEPIVQGKQLQFQNNKNSLRVIVGERFKVA